MFLSIVIPAYNEEKRLQSTLEQIRSYLNSKNYEFEIIVVDDGSSDKTKEVALNSALYKTGKLKLLENDKNKGKGFSVRRGILTSKGDYVLFSDADLSTPIYEVEKLIPYVESGFDIVIGSRSIEGSDVKVRQPFYREFMGRIFNIFVRFFALEGFIDTQCGFKLFKTSVAKDIAKFFKINGYAFDVEMLFLAKKMNYKIKEVPVVWINSFKSKVNPVFDSYKMFIELLSIKRLHSEN